MSKWYMITASRKDYCKKVWKLMIEENDIHEWIIAKEEGQGNYDHWQIRVKVGSDDFHRMESFKVGNTKTTVSVGWTGKNIPKAHVEECSEGFQYERKEGNFWCSDDTSAIRSVRFGTPSRLQRKMLHTVKNQSDRQIDVFYDSNGNHGKSWLSIHLWEKGRALLVPRSSSTPASISAFICSAWKGEEFIIVDIPRSRKVTHELYETLEEIKDGMVYDPRYSGRARNVRGTKLIVFTNQKLDLKALSYDRWRIHGISGEESP